MKKKSSGVLMTVTFFLCASFLPLAKAGDNRPELNLFARQALSPDSAQAELAVKALRDAGPQGMQVLCEVYSNQVAGHLYHARPDIMSVDDKNWERLHAVFDAVGEQRDAYASGLYWYTNLDQAMAAARIAGKPILSLRLLGRLDEEYSCANSRFFRATLYPDPGVSSYLRDNFILHWQSVRPVPRITIDMGDGRRIERTITGNSIHYVLDQNGNPVDALPGLYGAHAFVEQLKYAVTALRQSANLDEPARVEFLRDYHAQRLATIRNQWAHDLAQIGVSSASASGDLEVKSTDEAWQKMGALHATENPMDAAVYRVIASKQPSPPALASAMRLTASKAIVETPMMRMIRNLQSSISEDTVRNEYQFHSRIHEWLARPGPPPNLAVLNRKIYADLFLTPDSDPWLGLAPADRFSALDHAGLIEDGIQKETTAAR